MAKGWESKSVEAQMESAAEPKSGSGKQLTQEEREFQRKRDTLRLSRANVLRSLESCGNERYRQVLQKALSDLDIELKKYTESE